MSRRAGGLPFLNGAELAARGQAVALRSAVASLSYAELALRAAGTWRQLLRGGVLPGEPVALVSSARAHDEPVALAAILTMGAIAVPLDASAPPARLAAIVRARAVRAIVHDEGSLPLVTAIAGQLGGAQPLPTVVMGADGSIAAQAPLAKGPRTPAPTDRTLACILHTSGSTGEPKPVPITWAGLDAFTGWAAALIGLSPSDRVLRVAELVFDLAWFDHLATWRSGATLLTMSRRDLVNGRAVRDAIAALEPTVIYGVPSLFMKLAAVVPEGSAVVPTPRALLYAGEVFPPRELATFAARVPGAELYNFFGPTETNVCTFHHLDRAALDGARETPIGIACPYAACSLVGDDGRLVEGAGTGELVVSGPTTLGGGPHATRDRVERGADGLFYFRGRIDRMVKVRGYRVEPGEVEVALAKHAAVRQAAVVTREDERLGTTLAAFVVLRDGAGTSEAADGRALRMFLAESLPAYMVPERVSVLEAMPLGTTGKVDYGALRARAG